MKRKQNIIDNLITKTVNKLLNEYDYKFDQIAYSTDDEKKFETELLNLSNTLNQTLINLNEILTKTEEIKLKKKITETNKILINTKKQLDFIKQSINLH